MYTQSSNAVRIFVDALKCIAMLGWWGSGLGKPEGNFLLYVSFHVHPNDADKTHELLLDAIQSYGGVTQWVISRSQRNRFVICPIEIFNRSAGIGGNIGKAAFEINNEQPDFGYAAACDLIKLADEIYRRHSIDLKCR
jgi:hypothetical protein